MDLTGFQWMALISGLTALCGWVSVRGLKMKGALGMAAAGCLLSLVASIIGVFFPKAGVLAKTIIADLNFQEAVFHGMLCFLIFAGAMHVDLKKLNKWKWHIGFLASAGVLISMIVTAGCLMILNQWFSVGIPGIWLFIFGALIAPTDPIAVIALLKKLKVSRDLEAKIAAESLFNDGMAVVAFGVALSVALGEQTLGWKELSSLCLKEVFGALMVGGLFGGGVLMLLKSIEDAPTETAITLACALCTYAVGEALHVSAPLAVSIAGVLVGAGKRSSMSAKTLGRLLPFWEMLDELLMMGLFALVGLAMMAMELTKITLVMGVFCVLASLLGRWVSVLTGLALLKGLQEKVKPGSVSAMTWGGLRGGLSLAMAMSLPESPWKEYLVAGTWCVVMFSLLIQAPTMTWLLKKEGLIAKNHDGLPTKNK